MTWRTTIPEIAHRTSMHSFRLWGYGEAIAMDALIEASRTTGILDFRNFVERSLRLWMVQWPELSSRDHVAPGRALLEIFEVSQEQPFLDRGRELGRLLTRFPSAGSDARIHRPEESNWIFVDCIYTDGSFLSRLARLTGEAEYHDSAVQCTLDYVAALQHPSDGLFYHGRDEKSRMTSPYYWGRGNGWALIGLIDLLCELPKNRPGASELRDSLERLLTRMIELQDVTGDWHTILDYPESRLEPSVASMFVYAVAKGIRHQLISPERQESLQRAWRAVQSNLESGGRFPVSEATAVGDFNYYNSLAHGIYPWGQGPVLLAACEMERKAERR